jgi:AcrR family transcriptional regulator
MMDEVTKPAPKVKKMRKSTRDYHHGDLKNALVNAGIKVLGVQGVEALTLREVAYLTGVSASAVYRHFASKEHLLAAIAEDGYRVIADGFVKSGQLQDPKLRLQKIAEVYVGFAIAHPDQYRLMFSGRLGNFDQYPDLLVLARPLSQALAEVCAQLMATDVRTPFKNPLDFAVSAWSLVHGYCRLSIDGELTVFPEELRPSMNAVLCVLWDFPRKLK